ncbi:MAG TPA: cyclic pyranopterin phosphate synthase MoaA, partial [Flavobacteriales bacterium]|nr:cyclic pyranopterin phosphate synthase MoaA [Flavobacteriales bacterium]
ANSLGTFGIISSVTNPFCDSCNRIRLTADGKIKNCLFSQSETDLLKFHRAKLPLEPIIKQAIASKLKERGGIKEFSNETAKTLNNRSMIRIGG